MNKCHHFHPKVRKSNKASKSITSKTKIKKTYSPPHYDKENLLKQINDQILKRTSMSNINKTMKEMCQRNQKNLLQPLQSQTQTKLMIQALMGDNRKLARRSQENEKKILKLKQSKEYCQFEEVKCLLESYQGQIQRMKKIYLELKASQKQRKILRKQSIVRKKEKKMMDSFLLEELMEENQDLEEQYNETQELFSKVKRKNIENYQRKTKLTEDIDQLKLKLRKTSTKEHNEIDRVIVEEENEEQDESEKHESSVDDEGQSSSTF